MHKLIKIFDNSTFHNKQLIVKKNRLRLINTIS